MYNNFLSLLQKKGVSSYRVAKDLNLSPTVFSDWKRGKSKPKIDKLMQIAQYFDVTLEDLVQGKSNQTQEE